MISRQRRAWTAGSGSQDPSGHTGAVPDTKTCRPTRTARENPMVGLERRPGRDPLTLHSGMLRAVGAGPSLAGSWRSLERPRSSPEEPRGSARPPSAVSSAPGRRSSSSTATRSRARPWPRSSGGGAAYSPTDVTNAGDVAAAIELAGSLGPLRIAVNCAGVGWAGRVVARDGTPHDLDLSRRSSPSTSSAPSTCCGWRRRPWPPPNRPRPASGAWSSTRPPSPPSTARSARSPTPRPRPASSGSRCPPPATWPRSACGS